MMQTSIIKNQQSKEIMFQVVMPCYNSQSTVGEAIKSVLGQSEHRFLLTVVDDGSSDNSLDVIEKTFGNDKRCSIGIQKNSGPSAARNNGALLSDAPLLAFIDADDRWHPKRLEAALAHFDDFHSMSASFCGIHFYDPLMQIPGRISTVPPQLYLKDILAENACCTSSTLVFKRKAFMDAEGFDTNLRFAEDQDLVARIIAKGGEVRGFNSVLVDYRTSHSGLSSDLEGMYQGWRDMISRVKLLAPKEVKDVEKHAEAIFLRYLARRALRLGSSASVSAEYIIKALRADAGALINNQPLRTAMTIAGVMAAFIPGIKHTSILRR